MTAVGFIADEPGRESICLFSAHSGHSRSRESVDTLQANLNGVVVLIFRATNVSASREGDYVQLLLETNCDDGPYLIIQHQFEDDLDHHCYVETHDTAYCGHFLIKQLEFSRTECRLTLDREELRTLQVGFELTCTEYQQIANLVNMISAP